jgi:hypothetical protein
MNRCVLTWAGGLLVVLAVVLQTPSKGQPVDINAWDVPQFINHLQAGGLDLKVVSTRRDGHIGNSVYLSSDPQATWLDFQRKGRALSYADDWQGAVWIESLDLLGSIEWPVEEWGVHGCQIGRFVVFGDPSLVERIARRFEP